jgi:hypothetical protein
LQDVTYHKRQIIRTAKALASDIPTTIMSILKLLIENEVGKQIPMEEKTEKTITSFIGIIDGIFKRDLRTILYHLRGIKHEFGGVGEREIDLLECFVFMTNKLPLRDSHSRNELLMKSIEVITEWLFSLMKPDSDSESIKQSLENYKVMIQKLMTIVMGAIHGNFGIIKQAMKGFIPMIDRVSKLVGFLKKPAPLFSRMEFR